MAEMTFEILRLILMIAVFCVFRFLIPWMKTKLGNEKTQAIKAEVEKFVLATQQMHGTASGAERLAIVTEKTKEYLIAKNISLTDDQIRDFIEAAVKAMKMAQTDTATAVIR